MEEQETTSAPRIFVGDTPYVLPPLDTFDLDEAMVMYRYSDLTFDQIFELEGLHPGVVSGLLYVAIARSDPALRDREIKAMVSKVNMMNVLEQLAAMADAAPDPTKDEAPPVEDDSKRSSEDPTGSSGSDGSDASEPSLEKSSHDSSGTPDSDIAATSDQTTLVISRPTN